MLLSTRTKHFEIGQEFNQKCENLIPEFEPSAYLPRVPDNNNDVIHITKNAVMTFEEYIRECVYE